MRDNVGLLSGRIAFYSGYIKGSGYLNSRAVVALDAELMSLGFWARRTLKPKPFSAIPHTKTTTTKPKPQSTLIRSAGSRPLCEETAARKS